MTQNREWAFPATAALEPGIGLYATPEDVHTVRNASKTKPAKFVVFFIQDEEAPILTPVYQLGTREIFFPDEPFLPKSNLPYVEARVNSKAAQLSENGAEIVCLFARIDHHTEREIRLRTARTSMA